MVYIISPEKSQRNPLLQLITKEYFMRKGFSWSLVKVKTLKFQFPDDLLDRVPSDPSNCKKIA